MDKIFITNHQNQRDYFPFTDYEYILDVSRQNQLLPNQKDLFEGLKESYKWYKEHSNEVLRKDYIKFIEENFE